MLALTIGSTEAAERKRVLIIHSFGSAAPPFSTEAMAFETALTQRFGEQLDIDEISQDHARYGGAEMEDALVEYLINRQARWQADLVVPLGSPAGVFVAEHRDEIFPETPVLYAAMDKRRLPANELQNNAAFVGTKFDVPGFVEDILHVAPTTTNIAVVIGDSEVEQYWAAAFQKEFEAFTNRVSFTWLNHLPFDHMLERVSKLPPRSFVFLILLMRDAAGVTHDADEALKRIHAVANAPVNSIFEHQLGLGILGGRLYSSEAQGVKAAEVAIRILNGKAATNFPAKVVRASGPQYDWRELRRWNISENHLPPGSTVRFRQLSTWQRHRTFILAGGSVFLLQAVLIAVLIASLVKGRRAERELLESEEQVKLAVSAAELSLWEWEMETDLVWLAGPLAERMGISRHDRAPMSYYLQGLHPDEREGVRMALQKSLDGDGDFDRVHRRLLPDGTTRWLTSRGRVEFDEGRKPLRMRGISMDITAQKEAEDRANQSEARFIKMANSAPVLMWASGPDKLCTFCNQAWLDFKGRTMAEERGEGWAAGVHPEDFAEAMRVYSESFDARRPFTMVYRLRRHDGEYRWMSDHGVPCYEAQNQFVGYLGSCVDITDHKKAEEQAERSREQMTHLTRVSTLGALGGSLAHELNQPLTSILCNAQAASRFLDSGSANITEIREILKDIISEDQRAGEIIVRMRAMLKKERAKLQPQDLNQVIREVLGIMRSELLLRNVTPITRLASELPSVEGDRVRLQQVLINLVVNGCDAMTAIPVHRRQLTLETRDSGSGFVEATVADYGPGFSSIADGEAFEPFRTTKPSGLGLGLPICRSIIESHGGKFWAGNRSEGGAVVSFTLPVSAGGDI